MDTSIQLHMGMSEFDKEAKGYSNIQLLNIIKKISKKNPLNDKDACRLEALKKEAWKRELELPV